jgi:Sec-independent protein translocase protein TatA
VESFFGIGGPELLLILVLATIILGPLNMIKMARQFGILLRDLRNYYQSLTANLSQELGDLAQLQETLQGELDTAIPKSEELQVTVPDLMGDVQRVLNPPVPSGEPASELKPDVATPVQTEASPSEPVISGQAEPKAVQVIPTAGESDSQPQEPERTQTAQAPADSSEAKS